MFHFWLIDESATGRMPDAGPGGPLARDDGRASCATAIDAIGLFNKRTRARAPSVCHFADF